MIRRQPHIRRKLAKERLRLPARGGFLLLYALCGEDGVCLCKVRGYTEQMLKQRGIKPRESYETIAEPGFSYSPATASLSRVWDEKVLDAPDPIKALAKREKSVSDMYDSAFDVDPDIQRIMGEIKPKITVHKRGNFEAFYEVKRETISFWHKPISLATLQHESGYRLDHVNGWISKSIQAFIANSCVGSSWIKHPLLIFWLYYLNTTLVSVRVTLRNTDTFEPLAN